MAPGSRQMSRRWPVVARAGLLATMLAVTIAGSLAGWSQSWNWVESAWRLDVGAPPTTSPYPTAIGAPLSRLVAAGDVGTGTETAYRTAAAMDRLETGGEFDALLLLGDNVYPSGDPTDVDAKVLDPFGPVLDGPTQLVAALGNHDVETGDGEPLLAALGIRRRWYVRRYGPVRVIVVDSTRASDPTQLAWLERRLNAATDATWTVVVQHHPPFSAGYHGSHGPSREWLVPLYERGDVDLVLAGHDHDYQRTHPQAGVTYVVSGGAATLRPTGTADFTVTAASTYHFVELAALRRRLEVRAIGADGRVIDQFDLPA